MNKKFSISFGILLILVGIYFINQNQQKGYSSKTNQIFDIEEGDIKKILIQSNDDALEIARTDTSCEIIGHDSLKLKDNIMNTFFDRFLSLESERIMTQKKENWIKYNIDDSQGTHLALIGHDDNTIEYLVFGRSNSDFARCYIRKNQSDNVHLANQNIIYILQTNPNYWGQKPTPVSETIAPLPSN